MAHSTLSGPAGIATNPIAPARTSVADGVERRTTGATCPPPLARRSDGSRTDVDWRFISAREGGQVLAGYVPDAAGSRSGVTIGTGVDLGQRGNADIDALDISADLKARLKPYAGKKSQDAADCLKQRPLAISADDATSLDKAVKQPLLDRLIAAYDAAVARANLADQCQRVRFDDLPRGVQTALASANFQYGSLSVSTPNYWKQVTEQRWQDESDNLRKFGDAYPSRRRLEAGLIDAAIAAAAAPSPAGG